ncbi:MOSC domain-containing protein [Lophium mytilinum]|uniref:MOSC domain-containing protein n=1 Tax=Lophium mytilinum TaxID=390894 RepID=A0A6A6QS26_9PEZI|nr:MOSC domain-containing protein [Lophium mytilinum]
MKISQLYTYPIKSLRPTAVTETVVTKYGFPYDRKYILLRVHPDRYEPMQVSKVTAMTLFFTRIIFPEEDESGAGSIIVTFKPPSGEEKQLSVPLLPDVTGLDTVEVSMYRSGLDGYKMQESFNKWFSDCFGYDVILVHVGNNTRPSLFGEEEIEKPTGSWFSSITSIVPGLAPSKQESDQLTFTDCASYLVVSQKSLEDVSSRLPEGEEMDITKFRPNVVVEGAGSAWEEDLWGAVRLGDAEISLKHNCGRCASINVDYSTGKPGTGEAGTILKKLQKDRRVDKGIKYTPVFGRYGFLEPKDEAKRVRIGDEVFVTKRNSEPTTWNWKM